LLFDYLFEKKKFVYKVNVVLKRSFLNDDI